MERGPMALFGAIVAVGLGPALWLGAQFGDVAGVPSKPPAATSEHQPNQDLGGVAGAASDDTTTVLDTNPRGNLVPLSETSTIKPSASATAPTDAGDPTAGPTDPTTEPTPSDEPTTPPTEATTDPTIPPADDDPDDPAQPPVPPGGSDEDPTGGQGAGTGTEQPQP